MPFYIRKDAEKWFNNIKNQKPFVETKFDLYYFCLMLGLYECRKTPVSDNSETTEFQKVFVKSYVPAQKIIIGLLICAELKRLGIDYSEKDDVHKLISNIIDTDSPTKLSDKGMTKLNEYASGGYEVLTEKYPNRPYKIEEFIRSYAKLFNNCN